MLWFHTARVKWHMTPTESLHKFTPNPSLHFKMDYNSYMHEFLHLSTSKIIQSTASCDSYNRCLASEEQWVSIICTSKVSCVLACNSSSCFWTCHTLSPISSSRLWKKQTNKKEQRLSHFPCIISASQLKYAANHSVRALRCFRPQILFGI